jgi:hypothetical protein
MADQNNDSFKSMSIKEKTVAIIGITFLIILVIGFVFGIYFFGFVGVFKLLGIHYQSYFALVIFVASFFMLGILVDLFFDAVSKLAVERVSGTVIAFFIQMLNGFTSNWLVLFTVDTFMESITLSLKTKLIVALLLAVLEPIFDNKKKSS